MWITPVRRSALLLRLRLLLLGFFHQGDRLVQLLAGE
jgi:hypothetical protein